MSVVVKGNAELENKKNKIKLLRGEVLIVKNYCHSTEMPLSI